jgi:hypothetical protein
MEAAADLGRQGPRVLRDPRHRGDNPQVKPLYQPSAVHDPNATADREIMGHMGLTAGLWVIGGVLGPAASMIFGQIQTARTTSRPSSSKTLGR